MTNEEIIKLSDEERLRYAFEQPAKKKGYSLDKDDLYRYEDNWLQEAWEIFALVDFKVLIAKGE